MRGQLLILGMSDSGTNWTARAIQESAKVDLRYFREFFNPICNLKHAKALSETFGCEVPMTIPNIARPAETQPRLSEVYGRTWMTETYNCTKENYSVWKVPFLATYFDIVAVYREPSSLWPPARYRVVTWYNAVYESIRLNFREYDTEFQEEILRLGDGLTIAERAEAGHALAIVMLHRQAKRWRFPIISYGTLMTATETALIEFAETSVLSEYVDPQRWAKAVVSSRRPPDQSQLTEVWRQCRKEGR